MELVNSVDHLRPKIPGMEISSVDALVEPVHRYKDSAQAVLLNQLPCRALDRDEHAITLLSA